MSGPSPNFTPVPERPKRTRRRSHPKFVVAAAEGVSDGEADVPLPHRPTTADSARLSRATSSYSFLDSPPVTPHRFSFGHHHRDNSGASGSPHNPFASSRDPTPPAPTTPGENPGSGWPFPELSNRNSTVTFQYNSANHSRASLASRPGTAGDGSSGGNGRPFSIRSREAFASPRPRPLTVYSSVQPSSVKVQRERLKSTMLQDTTTIPKPWLDEKDPYNRVAYWLTYAVMMLGIGFGALKCYLGWVGVPVMSGNLCVVMDENFDSDVGLFGDNGKFFREVDMSGFGNGEFEMTTDSSNQSYVKDGFLYITPTLTADVIGEAALMDGYTYNITGCTYNITQGLSYTASSKAQPLNSSAIAADTGFNSAAYMRACTATSNVTSGQIINPVQTARLSTRKTASIKYGRVEVRAKIPTGDWLWPAIWMLPVENTYGPWPISGEIDIMEARGNGPSYPNQGNDYVRGSLNWGPLVWLNSVFRTFGWWKLRRGSYSDKFHVYALEWDEKFMRIYVDNRLNHLLDLKINEPFFDRGDYPAVVQNGSQAVILQNPWSNGTKAAPFDQPFYLIMNIAVGGTNGWFPDGPEKPWLDGSQTAPLDFWRAKNKWLPTWGTDPADRSMIVDYVRMWQKC